MKPTQRWAILDATTCMVGLAMRTTLQVDDHLFEELMLHTGARTKTEAVRLALAEYIRQRKKEELLALFGNLEFDDDVNEFRALDAVEEGGE